MHKIALLFILFKTTFIHAGEVQIKNWQHRVYLASYPRSGNHWLRYLIEEATGIATSSVYQDPDPPHLDQVFPWGGYCCDHGYEGACVYPTPEEPVVIKTHFPALGEQNFDKQPYYLTIRIIRHPLDSLYSFYLWNQHYQKETAENFIPKDLLEGYVSSWKEFQMYWDIQKNVITIRYEDFYKEPAKHLRIILEAIGYKTTTADIKRALQKHPPTGGFLKYLNHFTKEDKAFIETELSELMSTYNYGMTTILW